MTSNQEMTPDNHENAMYQTAPSSDERLFACLIYVLSFFASVIAPLIIWLIYGKDSKFVSTTAKNYFNSFISYTIWFTIAGILMFVIIGLIIFPVLTIMYLVFTIIAAVKAYNGEKYLIPLSIPFFK